MKEIIFLFLLLVILASPLIVLGRSSDAIAELLTQKIKTDCEGKDIVGWTKQIMEPSISSTIPWPNWNNTETISSIIQELRNAEPFIFAQCESRGLVPIFGSGLFGCGVLTCGVNKLDVSVDEYRWNGEKIVSPSAVQTNINSPNPIQIVGGGGVVTGGEKTTNFNFGLTLELFGISLLSISGVLYLIAEKKKQKRK